MKRSRAEIIYDILSAIEEKSTIKPTHILYKANLSHNAMMVYLNELLDGGFIKVEMHKEKKIYILTQKGYEYLQEYRKFKNFSDAFGI